ncbi:type II toxin-antitoxin system PemK/MazF family toxin [Enterococcus timonensis]|uniref:type II toxin-antitoxin system PemK/MazF family toxin n=1 Tax=Enterococcus timonensis TaxID=1852364 RepID=UPI0009F3A006|nr:type II toxin-antitoxin system PemK/MazF family toxin [Enterococcus timonensis]
MMMNKNDIFIGYLPFSNQLNTGKIRPVLLIAKENELVHVFKITSQYESKSKHIKKQYYQIQNWEEAGLKKKSWIDIGAAKTIDLNQLKIKKIGQLSINDQEHLALFIKAFYGAK